VKHLSVGASEPMNGFGPDVKNILKTLTLVLETGANVVMVFQWVHYYQLRVGVALNYGVSSYGGVVGSEAVGMYLQDEAGKKNGRGKVLRMVYCASFVMHEGDTVLKMVGGKNLPWWRIEVCRVFSPLLLY